jgi:predicted transcriptional regulator
MLGKSPKLHMRDLMKTNPLTILLTSGFSEIAEKFIATRFNYLYVTDDGRFLGAISLHDIKSYLNAPKLAKVVIAGDLLRDPFPVVRAIASLTQALERFSHHDGERLPVVSPDRHLVGAIAKTDMILALAGRTPRATHASSPAAQ